MGLLAAARSFRLTLLVGAALFGFYFLAATWAARRPGSLAAQLFLVFLLVLVLYGLWSGSPLTALGVAAAITLAWAVASLTSAAPSPLLDPSRPAAVYAAVLGPPVAVGLGVIVRAALLRGDRPGPAPPADP